VIQPAFGKHHDRRDERAFGGEGAVSAAVDDGDESASDHAKPGRNVTPGFLITTPCKETVDDAKQQLVRRTPQLLGVRPIGTAEKFFERIDIDPCQNDERKDMCRVVQRLEEVIPADR
jgi:hypothetical protein